MKRIVIVGAGFGGLWAAKNLRRAEADVLVIDRSNHHLFQPLLYQVATAGLSATDIAYPVRSILRRQPRARVMLGEVAGVDASAREVVLEGGRRERYDFLVLATGARHGYFGNPAWEKHAPGLKSLGDALEIRRRILLAFEQAEMESDETRRRELLTFVLVGAGPTGVEMAGSIAELAHRALASDFRNVDPQQARVVLIEAGPRVLASFPDALSKRAQADLERLGVEVRLGARVEQVDAEGVVVSGERLRAATVLWAAGVVASPAGRWLGAETDRAGKVIVAPDLTVAGHPEIFVIGDTARVEQDGRPVPGVAPAAMQQGHHVAREILRRLRDPSAPAQPFRYNDKGNLATIGRRAAVADLGWLRIRGLLAWVAWLLVHIFYLIGFRNRLIVLLQWAWAYVTFQRGARII